MSNDTALYHVNTIRTQLAGLVREAANALDDKKVSAFEGLMIGQRAMYFATSLLTLLKTMPPEEVPDVLYVLEHATLTLPPTLGEGA